MDITIERFDPARHDAEAVARLVYQTDPSLMRLVFGDEGAAVPVIARLVGMEHNDYAGRRVLCACSDGRVVGVVAGLTGAERAASTKQAGAEWGRALGVRGMFRALRWGPKLERVATREVAPDEFYVAALAVDESVRGQGIGSRLLAEVFRDHALVVTDVNITKVDAIRFYERHGFVLGQKMTFTQEGAELGNYQIRRQGQRPARC